MGSVGKAKAKEVQYHEFTGNPGWNSSETHTFFDNPDNSNQSSWEDIISGNKDSYNAMKDFTGSSYSGYYAQLYTTPWENIPYSDRKKIAALSDAIRQYELTTPIVTYRRTDFQIFGKSSKANMTLTQLQAMEGKFIHNNSFLSSSAADRGKPIAANKVELKIHVPAGKGIGAFVGKSGLSSLGASESEFLLNNNLWFRIGKARYNDAKGKLEVDLYVTGRSKTQVFGSDAVSSGKK